MVDQLDKNKEVWKDIKGYEGFYKISNYGRVKALPKKITWLQKDGAECFRFQDEIVLKPDASLYSRVMLQVNAKSKRYLVHRLVASHFLKNSNNYKYVNHIDKNRHNNHYSNLEYCSSRENNTYSIDKNKTTSIYTGVCLKKGKILNPWQAYITVKGKSKHLGYYPNEVEAGNAYLEALERHGLNNKYAVNQ